MKVDIKSFGVPMTVKSTGIELEVKDTKKNKSKHLEDCFVTMTGLIWCQGRTPRANGVELTWKKLMTICEDKDTLKAALKAAKTAKKV